MQTFCRTWDLKNHKICISKFTGSFKWTYGISLKLTSLASFSANWPGPESIATIRDKVNNIFSSRPNFNFTFDCSARQCVFSFHDEFVAVWWDQLNIHRVRSLTTSISTFCSCFHYKINVPYREKQWNDKIKSEALSNGFDGFKRCLWCFIYGMMSSDQFSKEFRLFTHLQQLN